MKRLLLFALIMMFAALLKAQGPCTLTFNFTTVTPACSGIPNGAAFVSVTGGTGGYTYLWDAAAGSQISASASNLVAGNYSVIVTDAAGCVDTGYVSLLPPATPTPAICMVTCDEFSVNNIIYWDKTAYTDVDSFIVYRETAPGVYSRIAAISNDSLSEYTDTARSIGPANGDPNVAPYSYKIQIRDLCGNYGAMSPYHTTLYIEEDGLGLFSWTIPYTIESAATPVNNYILICNIANLGLWTPVATVTSTVTSALDPSFALHLLSSWRVKTDWSISCTPTRTTVNTSRSNIKHGLITTGTGNLPEQGADIAIYPNPATNEFTLSLPSTVKTATVRIVNSLGKQVAVDVLNGAAAVKQYNVSMYAKGIYTVIVESEGNRTHRKLVVN